MIENHEKSSDIICEHVTDFVNNDTKVVLSISKPALRHDFTVFPANI